MAAIGVIAVGCAQTPQQDTGPVYTITSDRPLSIGELADSARVIAKFRELDEFELADLEERLSRVLEGLVAVERETLQQAENQLARKQRRPARKITLSEAKKSLLDRLGTELALPMVAGQNRSVVAFGRVDGDNVKVSKTAYEVDRELSRLNTGATITNAEGQSVPLVK